MKIIFRRFLSVICFFSFMGPLQAEMKQPSAKEIRSLLFMQQNRPDFGEHNPLKGFSTFNVFLMHPGSKAQSEKIDALAKKELGKIGIVKKLELEVKNKAGEVGIDLSPFDIGSSLIYEIRNLMSDDGKELGIIRASLSFKARVDILKTKQDCSPYLWSSNCFLKGNTEKDLEKLVSQSLTYLLQDFDESYKSMNSKKPVFNVYTP